MKTWFTSWALVAALGVGVLAYAQAGDTAPPSSSAQIATQPPSTLVVSLALALLGAALAWYQKTLQGKTHDKLEAVAKDPAQSGIVRTLADLADDLEPVVASAVGHILGDFSTGATAGQAFGDVTKTAAADLVNDLGAGLKGEATKFFGSAGGAFVDFIDGLIKAKLHDAQAAGVEAAAKITTVSAAAAALNKPA